ncbi:MAG: arginine N-succinyltransferase [Gammaproteobacteria bacterium]|nr:arginine N-succinyltransferase [Gammaproteobacteria bacterium]
MHYPQTVIRPIKEQDLPELIKLAERAGNGMTNLPKDVEALTQKITTSINSFRNGNLGSEFLGYLFVLEDIATKEIVGCSGIAAAGSFMMPFYHFKLSNVQYVSPELNLSSQHKILTMVNDYNGCSEICSLFLLPGYRKNHNGLLLSRSRFLFMADYKERFSKTIIAEMRGVINPDGSQPFWDNVICKFIDLPFLEADKLTGTGVKQFISDLMPRYPIYTDYLPIEAQKVIDCAHKDTEPALAILNKEGFCNRGYVDIFDAGPMVECEIDRIYSVVNSKVQKINCILPDETELDNKYYLISNRRLDARMCLGKLKIKTDGSNQQLSELLITKSVAQALDVKVNDKIRFVSLDY